tara:strand:+ start:79 stop:303 length:225 start_codon:yes stop_codon:yes gene_type:complete
MPEEIANLTREELKAMPKEKEIDKDTMLRREPLELVRAYYRIDDPVQRKRLFELVKSLGTMQDPNQMASAEEDQ